MDRIGAPVRLTGSGLGCPTWPQCEPGSFVATPEMGIHGAIEFGNRLLTFVLAGIALSTWLLLARREARAGRVPERMPVVAFAVGLGIIAQAVVGGISVLLQLNPWIVGLHMFVSVFLILACVLPVHDAQRTPRASAPLRLAPADGGRVRARDRCGGARGGRDRRWSARGDGGAARNDLSTEWTAKVHAWSVWGFLALTLLGLLWAPVGHPVAPPVVGLLAAELLQGLIGYVQYFTHLPVGVVIAHMVGTTVFTAALGHLWLLAGAGPPQKTSGSTAAAMKTSAR